MNTDPESVESESAGPPPAEPAAAPEQAAATFRRPMLRIQRRPWPPCTTGT